MLYLGSFFGISQFDIEPGRLLHKSRLAVPPYTWRASMPRFGQTLDNILSLMQLGATPRERFAALAEIVGSAGVDSSESRNCMVRLTSAGVGADADPAISILGITPDTRAPEILEALIQAVADTFRGVSATTAEPWNVAGGAAIDDWFVRRLAALINIELRRADLSWTCIGSALASDPAFVPALDERKTDVFSPRLEAVLT
jgi:hypothetical protein